VVVRPISLVVGACLVVIGSASMIDSWVTGRIDWSRAFPVIVLIAGLSLAVLTITSWRRRA
jgi:cytochrome c oxidase subunit IV